MPGRASGPAAEAAGPRTTRNVVDPELVAAAHASASAALGMPGEQLRLRVTLVKRREKGLLVHLEAVTAEGQPVRLLLKQLAARPVETPQVGSEGGEARPRLAIPRPPLERARTEYEALVRVNRLLAARPVPHLGAVRPLGHLADHDAILMELFHGTNLRSLVRRPRFRSDGAALAADVVPELVRRAGAWLRVFHATDALGPPDTPVVRHERPSEIAADAWRLCQYLANVLHAPSEFEQLGTELGTRTRADLPAQLPLAPAHGDFAPRNVLVADDGTVAAVDIAGWMRAPIYEDIAYFVVALRTPIAAAVTQGLTEDPRWLDRLERSFVDGYFGSEPVPWQAIRLYQVIVLLDRWCSQPPAAPSVMGGRLLGALARPLVNRHFRREVRRLLALADEPGQSG